MSQFLSPEETQRALEGDVPLEELSDRLEDDAGETTESYDLVYSKDRAQSSESEGSVYTLAGTGSEWYEEAALEEIEIEDLEIGVEKVKMNAVTGETRLIGKDGAATDYNVFSTYEGNLTFTQELGGRDYAFRYDSDRENVKAVEVGSGQEPMDWNSDELSKHAELMEQLYTESRKGLWRQQENEPGHELTGSKFRKLRPIYEAVTGKIEQEGRAVINEQTHVGKARGAHIKEAFKQAVERAPQDSKDNYRIENDGNEYPIVIEEV